MAGHSKWANIKHKKAVVDAKKGKVFSKLAREMTVCARHGGGDVNVNITLRALVSKSRSVNMPADNIDRAIKKGTGELDDGIVMDELSYEGYASGGVAVIVEVVTDNKNRSAAEVRHVFTKAGASLATPGAVSRSFHRKGVITVAVEGHDEDTLMELALDSGAEDFEKDGEFFCITTDFQAYGNVLDALQQKNIVVENSDITMIPELYVAVATASKAATILRFIDALEDLEDVQNVYTNMDVDDAVMEALSAQ